MADFKFTCAHCGQEIELDELWSGHQIQCPTCQKEVTVPPKPDAPPHATFAAAKPGQARLSIGASHAERSATARPVAPQAALLEQKLAQAKQGQKGSYKKWIAPSILVIALIVGAVVGYPYVQDYLAKRSEAAKKASIAATQEVATATAPETPAAPAPEKELPLLPAIWTLDVDKAAIPAGKANGTVAGAKFVVENARLDKVGTAYLLQLVEGPLASPDRGFRIFLYLNAGETITNHTWTVASDMKGKGLPQVVKVAKGKPQSKALFSGYALKLELGDIADGVIRGKIFLAVPPDSEQSVVAGAFKATTTLGDPNAPAAAAAIAAPAATPAPPAPLPAESRRYGKKR
jgi:DNA-directed RNA polymerase subunit RPC12/RpoP